MSKHTPGPWEVHHQSGYVSVFAADGTGMYFETVRHPGAEADARLIAAAPALLEACQTFAEWLRREEEGLTGGIVRGTPEGERQWRIWWDENLRICNLAQQQVRAAIAKATGEQP